MSRYPRANDAPLPERAGRREPDADVIRMTPTPTAAECSGSSLVAALEIEIARARPSATTRTSGAKQRGSPMNIKKPQPAG